MFERGFKTWCEQLSEEKRSELGIQPTDRLDAYLLAKHLGIIVWHVEEVPGLSKSTLDTLTKSDPDGWSALTVTRGAKKAIILNSSHSDGRGSSNLMHEISHHLCGHAPASLGVSTEGFLLLDNYGQKLEEEADWLAGSLLLPRKALVLIRKKQLDIKTAARLYGVSQRMLTYRLDITGVNYQFKR